MDSTLKRHGNDRFDVVSTWDPRGLNVGIANSQFDFLHGYSCFSLVLTGIVHDINSSYDYDPTQDIRGVFLNIAKVFEKVWHEGLLHKLEIYSVKEKF